VVELPPYSIWIRHSPPLQPIALNIYIYIYICHTHMSLGIMPHITSLNELHCEPNVAFNKCFVHGQLTTALVIISALPGL
jgi:hypothetical protein